MLSRKTLNRRAFTLIELLVVVAIIAVLISLLLPALGAAREQGKTVKCLANLKSVGQAMHMYFTETNEWFPFEKRSMQSGGPLHGFYYGGHPGHDVGGGEWWGYTDTKFRDTPGGRPFNKYLYPNLPKYDVQPNDPMFEQVRKVNIFECPSDVGGMWNTDASFDPLNSTSTYYMCGNSYDENYHFVINWAYSFNKKQWLNQANAYLKRQLQYWAANFIITYEDPFDSAQWNNIPRRGWHRQWNRHSLLFLDGHSANMFTDTVAGNRGRGWKSGSASSYRAPKAWWNDPQDPDYKWRDVAPVP